MKTTYYRWSEVAKCGLGFSMAGCCESEARLPVNVKKYQKRLKCLLWKDLFRENNNIINIKGIFNKRK